MYLKIELLNKIMFKEIKLISEYKFQLNMLLFAHVNTP